jgi:hypothetical protein
VLVISMPGNKGSGTACRLASFWENLWDGVPSPKYRSVLELEGVITCPDTSHGGRDLELLHFNGGSLCSSGVREGPAAIPSDHAMTSSRIMTQVELCAATFKDLRFMRFLLRRGEAQA